MVTDYKGLDVVTAINDGGILIIDDFKEMADRAGQVYQTAGSPGVNDDSAGTAGNGQFNEWSKWRNTTTNNIWLCVDATPGAAIWISITGDAAGVGSIDGVSNAGGNVDLVEGANIGITPDNVLKRITIALDTSSNIYFDSDNVGVVFGAGDDCKISWDGADLVIDTEVAATGGVISVKGTTDYETNVTDDDDIPNKKYVDDAVGTAGATKYQVTVVDQGNTPYSVSVSEGRNTVFTNESTTAESNLTLPTLVANNGLSYTFFCQDDTGIKITAQAGETIRLGASVTVSGGYVSSTTIGSSLTLIGLSQSVWYASSMVGAWNVETS